MTTIKDVKTIDAVITKPKRWPLVRLVILFSVLLTCLYAVIVFQRGEEAYHESIHQGKQNALRLINTLSDHVSQTFMSVNLSLKRAVERQYFNELFGNNLPRDMLNNFTVWTNESPQISAMLMTDENGDIKAIYRKKDFRTWMEGRENIKELPFYNAHSASSNSELLYVGWQSSWDKNHPGFVILSRRLNKLNGRFGGIVLAAINIDYITNYSASVSPSMQTKIALMTPQYNTLINQVTQEEESTLMAQIIENHRIVTREEDHTTVVHEGSNHTSGFDDTLRVFSFKRMDNFDLLLTVINYGDDIFEKWRIERISDLIYFTIFVVFVSAISFFLVTITRQMQKAKKSEASALMASQAKSDFLANMSHELRTPLNAIIGFSEMLEAGYFGKLNSKQDERIHDINYCGTHLLELINDILEFSKGEAGKIKLHIEKVTVPVLIDDSVRILTEKSKRQNIKISTLIPDNLPILMVDPRKIKQILLNLISNAIKFTEENGTIEIACGIDETGNFILSVTDTGIGMKEEDIPKALSAFGQIHTDAKYGGTGLGLPLCKMFANLHGGDLYMHSIVGVGTKVTVMIPKEHVIWSN